MKFEECSDYEIIVTYKQKSFIYFLLNLDREVLYIGKTIAGFSRPFRHNDKSFDIISVIRCDKDNLDLMEKELIQKYRPRYNVTDNPERKGYWLKDKRKKEITRYSDNDLLVLNNGLTKKELAEKLKISVVTVNRMLSDGMPKVKVRGQVRFVYEDVEKWLKEGATIAKK